ncbi:MAG TPA: cytochrome P450, partial [Archangium sp.]
MQHIWRSGGDLTHVRMGSRRFFMVVHPEHVRHISVTQRQKYEKRESYQLARDLLLGHGVLTANGDDWRRQRKLMAPFFTPRGVEKYYPIMVADTQRFTERWRKLQGSGRPVEMIDEMMLLTAQVILHTVFSTESDETLLSIKGAVETMIQFVSNRGKASFLLP